MDKKEKELKMLEVLARKLLTCKPDGLPKEPRKYPSKKQLADYIAHIFIQQYYPNFNSDKQNEDRNKMSNGYSAVFIDLEDDNNQRDRIGGNTNFPDDDVVGYTPAQMQNAVKTSRKIEHVRDYLRDTYNNSTQDNLNDLFDFYIDIQ